MGAIISIIGSGGGLTEAEVQALIDASIIGVGGGQVPKAASAPAGAAIGDSYFNTTDENEYIFTSSGWVVKDVKDTEFQDLSGNPIIID